MSQNKTRCKKWFKELQNELCKTIENIERDFGSKAKFKSHKWKKGEFRIINGDVIEKGGIAFSNVTGKFPKHFAHEIPGTEENRNFWSSGVSVILHPKNPKVPALHFNTRHIITGKSWFGGGIDATPSFKNRKMETHPNSQEGYIFQRSGSLEAAPLLNHHLKIAKKFGKLSKS